MSNGTIIILIVLAIVLFIDGGYYRGRRGRWMRLPQSPSRQLRATDRSP